MHHHRCEPKVKVSCFFSEQTFENITHARITTYFDFFNLATPLTDVHEIGRHGPEPAHEERVPHAEDGHCVRLQLLHRGELAALLGEVLGEDLCDTGRTQCIAFRKKPLFISVKLVKCFKKVKIVISVTSINFLERGS